MGPLFPSIPHEAVIIARGRAASMRCARDCGAKPPKTAAWIAPRGVIARAAIRAAGIIGTTPGWFVSLFISVLLLSGLYCGVTVGVVVMVAGMGMGIRIWGRYVW